MSQIGYSTPGGSAGTYNDNVPIYSKFTASSSFTATKIHLYAKGNGGTVPTTCGIYADSAGSIGAKLSDTDEQTVGTSAGWTDFTLDTPVSIVNGTTYWLCQSHGSHTMDQSYDTGSYDSKYSIDVYSAGATPTTPSSVGALASDRRHSIYADDAGAALVAGTIALVSAANSRASLQQTVAPSGGTGTINKQWQRSTTSGSGFANVSGATGTTVNDSGLSNGTTYYYRLKYTDDSATVYADEVTATPAATSVAVCLGDSITSGYGLTGAGTATGATYPASLLAGLGGWEVVNAGANSDTLQGMEARLSTDVTPYLTGSPANVVIILGGINNFGILSESAATVAARVDSLCAAIRAAKPTAKILVGMLGPCSTSGANTFRNALNAMLESSPPDCDGLVHFARDARYGDDADAADTAIYQDGTHPTALTAGQMGITAASAVNDTLYPAGSLQKLSSDEIDLIVTAAWARNDRTLTA